MKTYMFVGLLIMATFQACGQQASQVEEVVFYYPNGHVKIKGTTKDGKKEGVSCIYYESGKKRKENNWENDIQVGGTTAWFENGNIKYKGQVKEGEEDGEWKYYDDLDGKYIYSVYYKNGEVINYHFSKNKYNWRKIDLPQLPVTFDFPSYIFDSASSDSYSCYWTMFTWKQKSEIEFYLLSTMEMGGTEEIKQLMCHLAEDKASYVNLFSRGKEQNALTPDPEVDAFTILPVRKQFLKDTEIKEVEVRFRDFDISLKSIFIPVKTKLYILSVYYNNKSQNEICRRFLNSVAFRPE